MGKHWVYVAFNKCFLVFLFTLGAYFSSPCIRNRTTKLRSGAGSEICLFNYFRLFPALSSVQFTTIYGSVLLLAFLNWFKYFIAPSLRQRFHFIINTIFLLI
jgi:hypothetical protein